MLIDQLKAIEQEVNEEISQAETVTTVQDLRVKYLGKKGPITDALRKMKDVPKEERPKVGGFANELKNRLTKSLQEKEEYLAEEALKASLKAEQIDVTLPGKPTKMGTQHIIKQVMSDIEALFISLGYQVVTGPEVESDYFNFQRMNLPEDHPARDMQDTFYVDDKFLLRTHTSPVQARVLDEHDFSRGPLKMVSPGKVYRRDADDATHSHQFHQIEGLVLGHEVSLADLKGTLDLLAKELFGSDREIRLRPSYFPFTEPSVEVDISCFKCNGAGCNICKGSGWIEALGAGMVHPRVLEMSDIDPKTYQGFAFGLGADRLAMLKYGIPDIRSFYQNDLRFLEQFQEKRS